MARTGRPKAELVLSDEERLTLEQLMNRRKSAQAIAMRARIVISCAKPGATNRAVATELGVSEAMVGKWWRRFVERRLDGLFDEPRPGPPRTITDDKVEAVIVKTLEDKPADATHWSTRSMAKAMGMPQTSISLIWRAFSLQPHRAESFELSTDPLFVDKVKDIVALYLDPPERAVVLCVDEKSRPCQPGPRGAAPDPGERNQPGSRHGARPVGPVIPVGAPQVPSRVVCSNCRHCQVIEARSPKVPVRSCRG